MEELERVDEKTKWTGWTSGGNEVETDDERGKTGEQQRTSNWQLVSQRD